jgi:hypothetical protein
MTIKDYLALVEEAYESTGGIEGQRAPLKTKTATTIRNRLVADIKAGAIVPPTVIGVLADMSGYGSIAEMDDPNKITDLIAQMDSDRISVIDGMQRTTAMLEAVRSDEDTNKRVIRVEFWIAEKVNSLIYRMLVLNTGQVPWEIGRQLETVYSQFLTQIKDELGGEIEIFQLDEKRRRVQAGQYQSKMIIELLLLFSSRKSELDIRDRVAEDFARLDAIETTSHNEFFDYFVTTLRLMSQIDKAFSRGKASEENERLKSGRDVLSSFPAMAGFFSAVSIELFDEPGFKIDWEASDQKMHDIGRSVSCIVEQMNKLPDDEIEDFLQLQTLEERLSQSQRSGQVGRFERELFRRAFSSMIRNAARLKSLEPCWKA